MTDRELLEAAARAAGIEHGADRLDCGVSLALRGERCASLPRWNPLDDDGDALRLAVKLRMNLTLHWDSVGQPFIDANGEEEPMYAHEASAWRRAIVRAAAAFSGVTT